MRQLSSRVMAVRGRIEFLYRPDRTYFPGETVSTKIKLEFAYAEKIRWIGIRFLGNCKVKWEERSGKHSQTRSSVLNFFKEYINIVGERDGPKQNYAAGAHVFFSTFKLPDKLPSSFTYSYAWIRYEAKIKLQSNYDFNEKANEEKFIVLSPFNFAEHPECLLPVHLSGESTTGGCFSWSLDQVTLKLDLPRAIFFKSDPFIIPVRVECDNRTKNDLENIKLVLEYYITLRTFGGSKKYKSQRLALIRLPGVLKLQKKVYKAEFEVPRDHLLLPTGPCESMIEASYYCKGKVSSGSHWTLTKIVLSYPPVEEMRNMRNSGRIDTLLGDYKPVILH